MYCMLQNVSISSITTQNQHVTCRFTENFQLFMTIRKTHKCRLWRTDWDQFM